MRQAKKSGNYVPYKGKANLCPWRHDRYWAYQDSESAVMRMLKKKKNKDKKQLKGNHSIRTKWQYGNDVLSNRDK